MTDINLATTDDQILACHDVMRELRPHIPSDRFVARVRAQIDEGYRLVCRSTDGRPVAVAGYRLGHNLAWGRYLYVDDLVTLASERSRGHGQALLTWLIAEARRAECDALHLDSGVQRIAAHRFYEREGLDRSSYHFCVRLTEPK